MHDETYFWRFFQIYIGLYLWNQTYKIKNIYAEIKPI